MSIELVMLSNHLILCDPNNFKLLSPSFFFFSLPNFFRQIPLCLLKWNTHGIPDFCPLPAPSQHTCTLHHSFLLLFVCARLSPLRAGPRPACSWGSPIRVPCLVPGRPPRHKADCVNPLLYKGQLRSLKAGHRLTGQSSRFCLAHATRDALFPLLAASDEQASSCSDLCSSYQVTPEWCLKCLGKWINYGNPTKLWRFCLQAGLLLAKTCFSIAQSCPTLCEPMSCSMPGLPVPHRLLELAPVQTTGFKKEEGYPQVHKLHSCKHLFKEVSMKYKS